MSDDEAPFYLTTREAAQLLRVSPETILRWINRGQLPAVRRRLPGGYRYLVLYSAILGRMEQVQPGPDLAAMVRPVGVRPMDSQAKRILEQHGLLKYVRGLE